MSLERSEAILDVSGLKMYFPVIRGIRRRKVADVKAVDGVNFMLMRNETLGLVGESGCGKTTIGRCILGLYRPTEGQIIFQGQNIAALSEKELRRVRKSMALIFQDPYSSLDPRQSVGDIVGEPLLIHHLVSNKGEYRDRVDELFNIVGLDPSMSNRFPHELSGGQRQRIGVARALASKPDLIVCDEPVSALDVSIQAQVINLLEELQDRVMGLSYLFIAHDLSVVRHISDRVAVMYLGHIVEICTSQELYTNPIHPYTRALLAAVPIADPELEETREQIVLEGEVPSPLNPPPGCKFHPRCPIAIPECGQIAPTLRECGTKHQVACIRVGAMKPSALVEA